MAEEQEQKQEQEQEQEQDQTMQQVLARLTELTEAQRQPAPQQPEVPGVPEAPEAPAGRITRQAYDELALYASARAQEAERLRLVNDLGLDATDLDGEYNSPNDMRQHAELLALRKHVTALEHGLEEERQREEEGEKPPPAPSADTGGPTGGQSPETAAVQQLYTEARALGRTKEGRQRILQACYQDPAKRGLIRTE